MNNDLRWINGMHQKDTAQPISNIEGEAMYTMFLADFHKMPDVNFREVSTLDVHVLALFN